MATFQFKIQLKNVEPPVWRRLVVPSNITFRSFHHVIQAAFGWGNYHLYQFSPKGWGSMPAIQAQIGDDLELTLDSETVLLPDIITHEGQALVYIYDFGDDWQHQIKLENISEQAVRIPLCTGGEGACPPEDCGGPPGYMLLQETLANSKNPEYKDMREWLGLAKGEKWDVKNAFNMAAVNNVLRSMCAP